MLDAPTINALRDLGLGIIAILALAYVVLRQFKSQATKDKTEETLVQLLSTMTANIAKMETNAEQRDIASGQRDKTLLLVQQSMAAGALAQQNLASATNTSNNKLDQLITTTQANAPLVGQMIHELVGATRDTIDAIGAIGADLGSASREQHAGLSTEIASAVAAVQHTEALMKDMPTRMWADPQAKELFATLTAFMIRLDEISVTANGLKRQTASIADLVVTVRSDFKALLLTPIDKPPVVPPFNDFIQNADTEHAPSDIAQRIIDTAERSAELNTPADKLDAEAKQL